VIEKLTHRQRAPRSTGAAFVAAFQQATAKRGPKRSARNGAQSTATRAYQTDELRELRALTRTMAQHIQALTLLTVVEQKRRIEALSASPRAASSICSED